MNNTNLAIIILAAGKGTRMLSDKAKVLHTLNNVSLIEHLIKTSIILQPSKLIIVTGHQSEEVENNANKAYLKHKSESYSRTKIEFVKQKEQLGTGDAVKSTEKALINHEGPIIIMPGDAPLIKVETLKFFLTEHLKSKAKLSVLTTTINNAKNYGRIIRDSISRLKKVVEAKDATAQELEIKEINSGFYISKKTDLFNSLKKINPNNKQNEYYLTDIIADYINDKKHVAAIHFDDYLQLEGINTKEDLLNLENSIKQE